MQRQWRIIFGLIAISVLMYLMYTGILHKQSPPNADPRNAKHESPEHTPQQTADAQQLSQPPYVVIAIHVAKRVRFAPVLQSWPESILRATLSLPPYENGEAMRKAIGPYRIGLMFVGTRENLRADTLTDEQADPALIGALQRLQEQQSVDGADSLIQFYYTSEPNPALKTRLLFTELHRRFPGATWYMKLDDDTFLYTRHLMRALQSIAQPTEIPHYLGYEMIYEPSKLHFGSGGAGYLLNRVALSQILPLLRSCGDVGTGLWLGPYEDVSLAQCLKGLQPHPITVTHLPGLHPHSPQQMALWDAFGHPSDRLPATFESLDATETVVVAPISYHYVTEDMTADFYDNTGDFYYCQSHSDAEKMVRTRRAIPKIIHQIVLGANKGSTAELQHCKSLNSDWKHIIWTETNIAQLGPLMYDINQLSDLQQKADILRLEILYKLGGVFVEHSANCRQSFDGLVAEFMRTANGSDVFFASDASGISNSLIGSVRFSESILFLIRNVLKQIQTDKTRSFGGNFLTDVIQRHPELPVRIFPAEQIPVHFNFTKQ